MLRCEMIPAGRGDCLWIEYGSPRDVHRVLIDGGPEGTYDRLRERILALPPAQRRFDLVVATHVDRDHISGLIPLLQDTPLGLHVDDIWFNAWAQIKPAAEDAANPDDALGPLQGEMLDAIIAKHHWPMNRLFDGGAVQLDPATDAPVTRTLAGGLRITLLSPTRAQLEQLSRTWAKTLEAHGFAPGDAEAALAALSERPELEPDTLGGPIVDVATLAAVPFTRDHSPANASSIAFIAELDGQACLFAGDALPETMTASIRRLPAATGAARLPLALVKLSHHGGKHNTSPELVQVLDAERYLLSTDGSYYQHPDGASVARVLTLGGGQPELAFNYRTRFNEMWADAALQSEFGYRSVYPADGAAGLVVTVGG